LQRGLDAREVLFRFRELNARLIVPAAPGFPRAPPPGTPEGFGHGGVDQTDSPRGGKLLGSNSQDEHEQRLALFIDFENIAIGVRDAHYREFDVNLVLERLLDKGSCSSRRPMPTGAATPTTSAAST